MLFVPDRRSMSKGRYHVIPQHFAVLDNFLLLIFPTIHVFPANYLFISVKGLKMNMLLFFP